MTNPSRILIDGSKFGLDWLKIYWYGALIVLGIIVAFCLCSAEAKRRNFHKDCVVDLCLWIVPLGAIFARIYYIVFALDAFIKPGMGFWEVVRGMLSIRDGGLALYGAVIGGVLGMVIYALRKKMHILSITDMIMPTVALAQAIGRWGNFFNQEAYGGVIADGFPAYFPLAVKIDECTHSCCAGLPTNLGNIHYATFFYESCWCLIIFIVLWFFVRKKVKHRGDLTLGYLIMYGCERAVVEGMRTDSLMLGKMRISQVLSVVLVVVSVILIVVRAIIEKKKGRIVMPVEEVYYGKKPDSEPRKKDDGWEDVDAVSDEPDPEPDLEPENEPEAEPDEEAPAEDAPEESGEDAE